MTESTPSHRPVHPGIGRPWPLIETAKVRLARPGEDCRHCDARPAAVIVEDGVLADEEHAICAPCLLDAVLAYPEHDEASSATPATTPAPEPAQINQTGEGR